MSSRWEQIGSLFESALELPKERRRAWLAEVCTDPDVRDEVEQMLAAHENDSGILENRDEVLAVHPVDIGQVPERVGPYHVVRELGRGGMGVVYHAYDPRLERSVALKFLPPVLQKSDEARQRFYAEARAAAILEHPNICPIYDVGESEGALYIAMAYCDGETLSQILERGPMPLQQAVDVAVQIAKGLQAAHEAGIVHRDIKTSNIIVTGRGEAKILDFGIAKMDTEEDLTKPGARLGTLHYMAPEQVRGEESSPATDLWALGVVLYEMLTARRPFIGSNYAAVLHSILKEEPQPIRWIQPDTPQWVENVVSALLSKEPKNRPSSAAAVVERLTAFDGRDGLIGTRNPVVDLSRAQLPELLTSFIGRSRELTQLEDLLKATRLLTLTGPAGTGKTRLSIELARRVQASFPNGVHFVSLAAVTDSSQLASAIADELGIGVPTALNPLDALKTALRRRSVLLVLDNFEQVVAGAPVVHELLSACPEVKAIVTSRVALRVTGEHQFPVAPLSVPKQSNDHTEDVEALLRCAAVQLFVERARAADPHFELTTANARSVAELCVRLDGLPLAIELAAARIVLLSPESMLNRLRARFDLLKDGPRDRPARHRSLRQAISWSYELLNPEERFVFRNLAVFAGGASLEAAEAVCRLSDDVSVLDAISALVEHSLIRQAPGDETSPRLFMLESIRAFAHEQLEATGELHAAQRRYAEYYLHFAEMAEPELTGPRQILWFNRLHDEHENLRAALNWARQHDSHMALRFGAALWRFWLARGHLREGRRTLEAICKAGEHCADTSLRARALNGLATLLHSAGKIPEAREVLRGLAESLRNSNDEKSLAAVLNNLGWVEAELCELESSRVICEEALALNKKIGDKRGTALALNNLGWIAMYQSELRDAIRLYSESLGFRREIGDQRGIAFTLTNIAWCELQLGNLGRCSDLVNQALTMHADINDRLLLGWALIVDGSLHLRTGDYDRARRSFEQSRASWCEGGNRSVLAMAVLGLAELALAETNTDDAAALLQESMAIFEEIGGKWGLGRSLHLMADLARMNGEHDRAKDLFARAIIVRESIPDKPGVAASLQALGRLHADLGEAQKADSLFHAAAQLSATRRTGTSG